MKMQWIIFSIVMTMIIGSAYTSEASIKKEAKKPCWKKTVPHLNMIHRVKCK